MQDDALKQLWKGQRFESLPELPDPAQIAAMKSRMSRFDKTISGRDYGEVAACLFNVLFFGWHLLFRDSTTLTKAGCLVIVLGSIFIGWRLIFSKRRIAKAEADAPVFDTVRVELKKVENQIRLLRSVGWWYLLPLLVGLLMFHWGGSHGLVENLIGSVIFFGIFYFILCLNQKAVKNNLMPLKQDLETLLHSAESGEPLDPEQLARLGKAMPTTMDDVPKDAVMFKTDFWQTAFYGEIGWVGIWFFLMIAVTKGNLFLVFSPKYLIWVVPFFLIGLLYSWFLQRFTVNALGVSSQGLHLNKGTQFVAWGDVKTIRLLKVLNIRSLWLIDEDGKETLLPWTGLERHADLKAAVEKFAPDDHPIRDNLPLLGPEKFRRSVIKFLIVVGLILLVLLGVVMLLKKDSKSPVVHYDDPVSVMLEGVRAKHGYPALAASVVVDGKIVVTNAVGFREDGGPERVTADDRFHLGSVTKSMTATVAAMLVEQGKTTWETTIGEAFPELRDKIHTDYLGVTLEQLLAHRGGAPGNAPSDLWSKAWKARGTPAEQRMEFVEGLLARKPQTKRGTKYVYSNQGYAIAGVMLEKASGSTWEDLMQTMLFDPLGMTTAGFGAPASVGAVDQPWGHSGGAMGLRPVSPGPRADNPLAISPAGVVHASLGDLAKYAAFHMAGERGESDLLSAESFKKLHTVAEGNEDYALGWVVLKRSWANGRALMHNGSNTMFYVVLWMAPEKNCAVMVATNVGSSSGFKGCDEAASNLIREYFGE